MPVRAGLCAVAALPAALAAAAIGGADFVGGPLQADLAGLSDDDSCSASAGGCGLSLRQLRVRSLLPTERSSALPEEEAEGMAEEQTPEEGVAKTVAEAEDAHASSIWPVGMRIPGGWGEAEPFVDEILQEHAQAKALESESAVGMQGMSSWNWHDDHPPSNSCKNLGCSVHYAWWLPCQCNAACMQHNNCCWDWHDTCEQQQEHQHGEYRVHGRHMKLYHQTGPKIGPLILANGFKPGKSGWCGGGIYFATSPKATNTKAIAPDSHTGFMIEAVVDLGRLKYEGRQCDRGMNRHKLHMQGYDTVSFNPGDGQEYVLYNPARVLSTRQVPLGR